MQRTIVGLALGAALGLLATGANFGCARSNADPGGMSQQPGTSGTATGMQTVKGGCSCGK
jgi:hypothetical protein